MRWLKSDVAVFFDLDQLSQFSIRTKEKAVRRRPFMLRNWHRYLMGIHGQNHLHR